MANIEEAIRRLKYLYEVHGADQVTAAMQAVTASTTGTERAALSLEKSFNSLERKYVSTVRHQQDYQRELAKANDALKQNPALQQRYNVVVENINQHYANAAKGANTYGKALDQTSQQGRLARHELINLSRQIQDVGVGIVSGQSPFTILVQQGAQIADVFASSTGTLKGFFGQVAAGAGRFIASTGGIVTATVAVAGSLGYVVASYASGQRDIERSLSGIGRASGVTRDQINAIGQASSSAFGLSASEAREAATAFAATGGIYRENVEAATSIVNDFARGGGDAAEMTKRLAAALQDPAKGALELNKELGFLDATTLNYIRTLQAAGDKQAAQAALMKAMAPAVAEQAKHVGLLTQAWNAATNAVSNYIDRKGKETLQQIERATGATPGGISGHTDEEQLVRFTNELIEVEKRIARIQQRPIKLGLREAEAESSRLAGLILDLENKIAGMNEEAEKKALAKLSLEADAAARSIIGATAQIFELEKQMATLRKYREQTGGPVTGAEQVGTVRLQELKDQEAATIRVAQATAQIAALYPGMSIETAKQLYDLQQQLAVAQARTGAEKLVAQEIATTNQLLAQGKTLEEATATAAAQRAVQQAQINTGAEAQLTGLQDQFAVASAVTGQEKLRAQEIVTTNSLIRQGVDSELAAAIASQERANAQAQINAQAQGTLAGLQDQFAVASAITGKEKMRAQETATYNNLVRQGVDVVLAANIAEQERVNTQAQLNSQAQKTLLGLQDQAAVSKAITGAERIAAQEQATYNKLVREGVSATVAEAVAAQEAANARAAATAAVYRQADALWDQVAIINATGTAWEGTTKAAIAYKNAVESGADAAAAAALASATLALSEAQRFKAMNERARQNAPLSDLGRMTSRLQERGLLELDPAGTWQNPFRRTEKAITEDFDKILKGGTSIADALSGLIGGGTRIGNAGDSKEYVENVRKELIDRLMPLLPEEGQIPLVEKLLAQAKQQPITLAREELIKELTDKLEGLKDSTDGLNDTIGSILSPFYSQDPRTTKLGFRAGSKGNADWLTGATNQTALDTILGKGATAPGGIAINAPGGVTVTAPGTTAPMTGTVVTPPGITGSQITRLTEAQRQQRNITGINNMSASGSTPAVVHNDNRIVIQGSVDEDTLSKLKISRYQQTQRMRSAMTAA